MILPYFTTRYFRLPIFHLTIQNPSLDLSAATMHPAQRLHPPTVNGRIPAPPWHVKTLDTCMVIYLHLVDFYGKCRYSKYILVGGFFSHPIWKICWSNWIMKPQGSGKNQRNTWSFTTHHTTFLRENIDNSSDLQKDDFFLIQNISIWLNGAIFHQPGFFWNSRGPISLPICYILGWGLLWGRYNLTRNIDFQGFHDTFQWEDS